MHTSRKLSLDLGNIEKQSIKKLKFATCLKRRRSGIWSTGIVKLLRRENEVLSSLSVLEHILYLTFSRGKARKATLSLI
jgi:hypothetical protein